MKRNRMLVLGLVGIMTIGMGAFAFADATYPLWSVEDRTAVVEEKLAEGLISQEQADLILEHLEDGTCDPENPAFIGQQARIGFGRALTADEDFVPGQGVGRGPAQGAETKGFGQGRGGAGGRGMMLRDGSGLNQQ